MQLSEQYAVFTPYIVWKHPLNIDYGDCVHGSLTTAQYNYF